NRRITVIERENRKRGMRLEGAFLAVDSPLLMVDEQALVRKINPTAADVFQVSPEAVDGCPFLQVVREHQIDDALSASLREGQPQELELDVMTSKTPGRYIVRIQPLTHGIADNGNLGAREEA